MTYKNSDEDLCGLTVRQLRARRRRLAKGLPDLEGWLRGSLVEQGRRCGKAGCRCTRGELHGPYWYLTVGRGPALSRLVYVPSSLTEQVRSHVELTTAAEAALDEISAINLELIRRRELA
jgi:transposase